MTDLIARTVPAGWYADQQDPEIVRWWNGLDWTQHVQPKPHRAPDAEPHASEAATDSPTNEPESPSTESRSVGLGFPGGYFARTYGTDQD